jgi:ubiquinone/menaquinone biosynthesis C-methylase UbiE
MIPSRPGLRRHRRDACRAETALVLSEHDPKRIGTGSRGAIVTAGRGSERYVPAAGRFGFTAFYDAAVGVTMRENAWRPALAHAAMADAQDGDVLDVGCGSGALTHALVLAAPAARVTGLDGDPAVLARARRRLADFPRARLIEGRADDLPFGDHGFDRVMCALLLHHLSPATQLAALREAARVLRPGGRLHVADWGRPRGLLGPVGALLLRTLDGFENTGPPLRGQLPAIVREAGFERVTVTRRVGVMWGTLELLCAELPSSPSAELSTRKSSSGAGFVGPRPPIAMQR